LIITDFWCTYAYILKNFIIDNLIYTRESNENPKSAIKIIYKYLRFSFDSPSYKGLHKTAVPSDTALSDSWQKLKLTRYIQE
jgi:hypothetical protein